MNLVVQDQSDSRKYDDSRILDIREGLRPQTGALHDTAGNRSGEVQ